MWVGMVVPGDDGAWRPSRNVAGVLPHAHPELAALEMTTMAAGMAAWMRYRGYRWASTLEMCAAMFTPAVILVPLLRLDAVSARSLPRLLHVVTLPMMVVMLWRRSQDTS
jgi:hypothetical protein